MVGWLVGGLPLGVATSPSSCRTSCTGFLSSSASIVGFPLASDTVTLVIRLISKWLYSGTHCIDCYGRRSLHLASRGDFVVPHDRTATRSSIGLSILWNPPLTVASPL